MTTLYCRPRAIYTDLRHIFSIFFEAFWIDFFPFGPFPSCQEGLAPGGTPFGSTRMPLAEDFQSRSTWVDGFSQHWRFRSVSWGLGVHGHICIIFRCMAHAWFLEYLTFWWFLSVYYFFLFLWIVGGGEWTGVPWLGCGFWQMHWHPKDVDDKKQPFSVDICFRPPAAIISLGSRWLHVVDATTFVGAAHQLKARHKLGLENGWMLETYPILSFLVVIFSAKINFNPIYFGPIPVSRHHSSTWQGLPSTWWDCATCLSCRTGGGTCGCRKLEAKQRLTRRPWF